MTKKLKKPRRRFTDAQGYKYQLDATSGTYHVTFAHPIYGPDETYLCFTQTADTKTSDPERAQHVAANLIQAEQELVNLVDEEQVRQILAEETIPVRRLCGDLPAPELRRSVASRWREMIESFGIEPMSAVRVVPVDLGAVDYPCPLVYWTSRENADKMDMQSTFERYFPFSEYMGGHRAICDGRLAGVVMTASLLACARHSLELTARVFLTASLQESEWSPVFSDLNGKRVEASVETLVLERAGLHHSFWHHRSRQTFPYAREYSWFRNDRPARSLLQLVELFALRHAQVIAQNVVLLFVDTNRIDPDLGGGDLFNEHNWVEECRLRDIRVSLFRALETSRAAHFGQVRADAYQR